MIPSAVTVLRHGESRDAALGPAHEVGVVPGDAAVEGMVLRRVRGVLQNVLVNPVVPLAEIPRVVWGVPIDLAVVGPVVVAVGGVIPKLGPAGVVLPSAADCRLVLAIRRQSVPLADVDRMRRLLRGIPAVPVGVDLGECHEKRADLQWLHVEVVVVRSVLVSGSDELDRVAEVLQRRCVILLPDMRV